MVYNNTMISFTGKVGVWVMSKCPFWSNKKEKISCSNECPMSPAQNNNEVCPFIEHLVGEKIIFKDILDDDFTYSQDTNLDYIIPSYVGYKDE